MTGRTTCPDCSAQIPVEDGVRTWCERCNWNVGGDTAPMEERFLARRYISIGKRYGSAVLEALKSAPVGQLRPSWTMAKVLAFAIAASVHLMSLTVLVAGLSLVATGWPDVGPMLLGAGMSAFAWLIRPGPARSRRKTSSAAKPFPRCMTSSTT